MKEKKSFFEWVDLYFKIIIGTATIIVTYLIGNGQLRMQGTQQNSTDHLIELQTLNLVKDYLPLLSKNNGESKQAEEIIEKAASKLSIKYGNTLLAEIAEEILLENEQRIDTTFVDNNAYATTSASSFKIFEATEKPDEDAEWFAVVGSFKSNRLEIAKKFANSIESKIRNDGLRYTVDIYRTKVSNHYAIVVGGPRPKTGAEKTARESRQKGWAKDAFAQIDRGWTQIER